MQHENDDEKLAALKEAHERIHKSTMQLDLNLAGDHKDERNRHIKQSKIWQTTQNIVQIHKQLADGYTYNEVNLKTMVNAMLNFLHAIIKPADPGIGPDDANSIEG